MAGERERESIAPEAEAKGLEMRNQSKSAKAWDIETRASGETDWNLV